LETIRNPAVAGQFYDSRKNELEENIKNCFLDKRGPGELPVIQKGSKKITGIIVPHAGYIYSGAIAAHSYNQICKNGFAETFIILGPNHTGIGSEIAVMTNGKWKTPIGEIPINKEIAEQINKDIIIKDENAHKYEHSIEIQLPFLQFCANKKEFDFVPISMTLQDYESSKKVGDILNEVINKSNKKIIIIASTDFSHVGFNYSTMPPAGMNVNEYAKKQDMHAIKEIVDMQPKRLVQTVQNKNITMCGYGPVTSMLTASIKLGSKTSELLKYGTSYDVHPSNSCVGYAAAMIY